MKTIATSLMLALGVSLFAQPASAEWQMKQAPLMTRFAADVDPEAPLPEYPRPQMTRDDWQNLNGVWQYQPAEEGDATPAGRDLSGEILVPFPVESALSGVMELHPRLWYRRQFTVPAAWDGRRILLHFGAVDWESEVFVNGKSLGVHKGGYDPFSYDVTDALTGDGPQELIVRVFDPTDQRGQPRGKQSLSPGAIMYTPTTGIWQTVWLEPVAAGGIESLKIVPDVDGGAVKVTVEMMGDNADAPVTLAVTDGENVVGRARGSAGQELTIKVPDAKLWSPDSPFLYNLIVSANGPDDGAVDGVESYFGMRKIEIADVDGVKKILLNGQFAFQFGTLDQGFWPDGIYTAPTDEALRYDIEMTKKLGFNFIRKHIKVEPARWYYHADRLGIMVWQDMPSANSYYFTNPPPLEEEQYRGELRRMVEHLRNMTCVTTWVIFNEGQGQFDTAGLVAMVRGMDPSRLINQASGGEHRGVGDVFDVHNYPPPVCPDSHADMALACGEFGGIGLKATGHMWAGDRSGSYTMEQTPDTLIDTYAEFAQMLKKFRDERGLSAAVYTQLTDIETEINGLLTYDRVPKTDVDTLAKATRFELEGPTYKTILPTSEDEQQTWQYTFDEPTDGWAEPGFDASSWKTGKGGFGTASTPNIGKLGTEWATSGVWMRRTFQVDEMADEAGARVMVRNYHDEDLQVFINGVLAHEAGGFSGGYENRPITDAARKALKPGEQNTLAVHCRQTIGGQYVDVGLTLRQSPAR